MTKTALLTSLAFASIVASGAPRPEISTYVDGNVSSLKPNTGGTLVFKDNDSMTFRTGSEEVAVPYASMQRAELGATQRRNLQFPKVGPLALLDQIRRTDTQLLTVEFKSGLGESQTMTLKLAKPAAESVFANIQEHTPKAVTAVKKPAGETAAAKDEWWGDGYWKTSRNQDSWNAQEAANAKEAASANTNPSSSPK
jgi:hypothetical protein